MAFGAVAQLGERRPCKAEVAGSIPVSSTKSSRGNASARSSHETEARAVAFAPPAG